MKLKELFEGVNEVEALAWSVFRRLEALEFPVRDPLSENTDLSYEDLFGLLSVGLDTVRGLCSAEEKDVRDLTATRSGSMGSHVGKIKAAFNELMSELDAADVPSSLAKSGNSWGLVGRQSGELVKTVSLNKAINEISENLDSLQVDLSVVMPSVDGLGAVDFQKRAKALSVQQAELYKILAVARDHRDVIEDIYNRSNDFMADIAARDSELEDLMRGMAVYSSKAEESLKVATVSSEKAAEIIAASAKLKASVESFQLDFDGFDRALLGRLDGFEKFKELQAQSQNEMSRRQTEIAEIVEQAGFMISVATTAGLASGLEDTRKRYERRMFFSSIAFVLSIILLVLSALPLVFQLLPGLFEGWGAPDDSGSGFSITQTLGKLIIIAPATWLTAFFSKAYADSLHMEREYAHKAALAMSVDGFKRQAPNYQEEITAEVFREVLSHPSKGEKVEHVSHPLYDALSKTVDAILRKDKGPSDPKE